MTRNDLNADLAIRFIQSENGYLSAGRLCMLHLSVLPVSLYSFDQFEGFTLSNASRLDYELSLPILPRYKHKPEKLSFWMDYAMKSSTHEWEVQFIGQVFQRLWSEDNAFNFDIYEHKRNFWRFGVYVDEHCSHPPDGVVLAKTIPLWLYETFLLQNVSLIPLTRRIINVGAGDGPGNFSSCDALWDSMVKYKLSGLYFEVDRKSVDGLLLNLHKHDLIERLRVIARMTTPYTIQEEIITHYGFHHGRIKVDMIKIDIDSHDCEYADSLLQVVEPSIVFIELNGPIPPPIAFVQRYAANSFNSWPFNSCSLTYAVELFFKYNMYLFKFTGQDAIFVSAQLARQLQLSGVARFPIDEFECFKSTGIMHKAGPPLSFMQDWFFNQDANESLSNIIGNMSLDAKWRRAERILYGVSLPTCGYSGCNLPSPF